MQRALQTLKSTLKEDTKQMTNEEFQKQVLQKLDELNTCVDKIEERLSSVEKRLNYIFGGLAALLGVGALAGAVASIISALN